MILNFPNFLNAFLGFSVFSVFFGDFLIFSYFLEIFFGVLGIFRIIFLVIPGNYSTESLNRNW